MFCSQSTPGGFVVTHSRLWTRRTTRQVRAGCRSRQTSSAKPGRVPQRKVDSGYRAVMVGSDESPLLFLDVDGTLIPFGAGGVGSAPSSLGDSGPSVPPAQADNPLLRWLDPRHGPRLLALRCQLVWATGWTTEANDEISPRLGLPSLPVVVWPDVSEDVGGPLHWKTRDLVRWADGRAFVWVDDEITEADRTWVSEHHSGPALLHSVESRRGLTEADYAAIEQWLAC